LQQYPFSTALLPDGSLAVCIDEESPRLSADGTALFEGEEPSEELKEVVDRLKKLHRSGEATQAILDALKDMGLISPWEPKISLHDSKIAVISGLYRIDEAALNELDDSDWLALRKIGAFGLIYGQLLSMKNMNKLTLLQNAKIQSSQRRDSDLLVSQSDEDIELQFDSEAESGTINFDNL
jgi:hypothetical protein